MTDHLTEEARRIAGFSGLHTRLAASHPSLARNRVWCRTCRREQANDSAASLRSGWPKCCGFTMTIDHPDTWEPRA